MKRLLLLAIATMTMTTQLSAADYIVCNGLVVDDQGEPVIGATVIVPGTTVGTSTDIDGKFSIRVADETTPIEIRYIGYKTMTLEPQAQLGQLRLEAETQMLKDVVVTQSVARTRETPVALSQIDAATIDVKLGNQEFPEILKTTPGVWATKDGGGYGDSKINMRGFQAENVAVMINGIPINDMEWGGVYWSNWAGLSDVTSSMQTQRGLGASMLSTPSVGGTINITTKSLDAKQGGTAWYGVGNDASRQEGISFSTGLMDNGWAMTVLLSHRQSDGYIQGTPSEAYNYFFNLSYRINDKHQLSFTAFGAPQTHDQRSSANGLSIEGWQEAANYMSGDSRYKYNPTFGYDKYGRVRTSNKNKYHKPQISLNHIWQINHHSSLSSAVYVSLASGWGYSGQGRGTYNGTSLSYSSWYGASNGVLNTLFRKADGTFAYDEIQEMNEASTTGSNMVMTKSINSHEWYGLVSTYRNEIIPHKLTLTAGVDFRYYIGHHTNEIVDLYGGDYYMDDSSRDDVSAANNAAAADPNWKYEKLGVGDVVYRDYDGHTLQEGAYAQAEYTTMGGKLNLVLSGAINNTSYWRVDHFYYDEDHEKSETLNFVGGTIKGGANYNINRYNNVFFNLGYISRVPFFSGGAFLSATVSNATNPDAINEKIASFEVGYGFHNSVFSFMANAYYTKWMDKTTTRSGEITSGTNAGDRYYLNMSGVDARHIGLEMDFTYRPLNWLEVQGMLSLGDYEWDSNAKGYFYNQEGQPLADLRGNVASGIMADDHAYAILNQKGVKVGGSAMTTGSLGFTVRPFHGLRVGADWVFSARNYSDYTISSSSYTANSEINVCDPWKIPWGNQLDLTASYSFKIDGIRATLSGNVNNLFDHYYVMDAYTTTSETGSWDNAYRIYYSFGRTYSVRLKINF